MTLSTIYSDAVAIGAGLSGTTTTIHVAASLTEQGSNREANIALIDPQEPGPGGPYRFESGEHIYPLNQPAYAMSPFSNRTRHYVDWLQERNPDTDRRTIETGFPLRTNYGVYLSNVFEKSAEKYDGVNTAANLNHIPGRVVTFDISRTGLHSVTLEDGTVIRTPNVLVTDGHHRNRFLTEFDSVEGFFSKINYGAVYERVQQKQHGDAVIIGTGQDAMDRVSELLEADFQNKIHMVSRRGVMPWKFDPELYHPSRNIQPYRLEFFSPERIDALNNPSFETLRDLWSEELKFAEKNGYGPGHVLGAFFAENFTHISGGAWPQMLDYIQAYYANPTAPQRYDMLQNLIQQGRIDIHTSSIGPDQIHHDGAEDGFSVVLEDGTSLSAGMIFNSAGCARTARASDGYIYSDVLRELDKDGHIKWNPDYQGIVSLGEQNKPGLYYVGPYAFPQKWGCETFRNGYQKVGIEIANRILTSNQGEHHVESRPISNRARRL